MKSPQFFIIAIIAITFGAVGYFVANSSSDGVNASIVGVLTFAAAFISPLLVNAMASNSNTANETENEGDIKTLYVGNLPYRANEAAVRRLFSDYGIVHSVRLMKDKHTGKRRGFGFVEMFEKDIDIAISSLNDVEFQQRTLKVREAKDRPERSETEAEA